MQRGRCVVVTEAGSYLRLTDFCITQLKAQGPSRTCNESKEEEEEACSERECTFSGAALMPSKTFVLMWQRSL